MEFRDSSCEPVAGPEQAAVGRSFSAGDVILTCEPWVWAFNSAAYKDHCANCFQEKQGLRTCSGCQLHRYCSKACQVSDWKKEHKLECAMLKKVGSNMALISLSAGSVEYFGARTFDLVAKIANKIKLNVTMDLGDQGTLSAAEIFGLLPANPSSNDGAEPTQESLAESATALGISLSEYWTYHQTGGYNAVSVYDIPENHFPFVLAIYPEAPVEAMTPVCWDVNATINFSGRRMIIVATQDIPNYTGLHDLRHNRLMRDPFSRPLLERRDVFKLTYRRPCTCRKCTKEFDAETNPLKCMTPECREPIPSDRRALAPCPQCGAINTDQLVKLMRFTEKCDTLWRNRVDERQQVLQNVEYFKDVKAETFLHPDAHIRYIYSYNRYLDFFEEGRCEEGWKLAQEMVNCLRNIHPKYDIAFGSKIAAIGIRALEAVRKMVLRTPLAQRKRLQPLVTAMCPVARSYCKEAEDLYIHVLGPDFAAAVVGRERFAELEDTISTLQLALNGNYR
ncbi:uncharacterized protein LOC129584208 [Paramacrobiotus metropolitanus]|uniref:uncharacterized protein LOC129584208 n=1 Tax=Paramacrobiotus metropolitanus TaxID=2943436 RepID=UPI0024458C2F|nr:uncharacterized protein LOC129584208 [Paramacrobiotus metropolitanus]